MTVRVCGVTLHAKRAGIADVGTITEIEWAANITRMGPNTSPSTTGQLRINFAYTPFNYTIINPGYASTAPPDWLPGDYGVFAPHKTDDTRFGWSALTPNSDDVYHYDGIKLIGNPSIEPRQAHRFVEIDGLTLNSYVTGVGGSGGFN